MKLGSCMFMTILVSLGVACMSSGESSLTIYNEDFAVVRQSLPLDLREGTNEVRVTDITARMEADSVILRDPQGRRTLQILEQNYRADPVSLGLLLSLYEGKEIDFLVEKEGQPNTYVRGRIIRSGYDPRWPGVQPYGTAMGRRLYDEEELDEVRSGAGQPIIQVNGKLRFSLPGEPLFPSLTDNTILKPTLQWLLQTDAAGKLDAELSYITGGMKWEADYSLIAPVEGDVIDVIGWVTMDNQSGRTFENARIKLMAGDVAQIQSNAMYMMTGYSNAARSAQPAVSEKAFDEYHLYTLNRPTTLRDGQTKQVEFLRAEGVQAQRLYVYDGARIDSRILRYGPSENLRNNRDYGTQSNPKVWVMREFKNSAENHLGIPLPKGRTRFYRRGDDGQLEFVGERTPSIIRRGMRWSVSARATPSTSSASGAGPTTRSTATADGWTSRSRSSCATARNRAPSRSASSSICTVGALGRSPRNRTPSPRRTARPSSSASRSPRARRRPSRTRLTTPGDSRSRWGLF